MDYGYNSYDDPDTEDVDESEEIEFVSSKTIEWNIRITSQP